MTLNVTTTDGFDTTGLLEPQKEHAIRLCQSLIKNGIAWDGSITGAGKTHVAASVIKNLKQKFVVICPKLAIPQWKNILNQFGLTPEFILNYEKLARGNTPWYKHVSPKKYREIHGIDDCNDVPEFLRASFKFPNDWLVVCDESHKMKGVESLQAGMLFNLKRQGYRVHLMSATQATTPLDMRAFGFATNMHTGGMKEFKQFAEQSGAEWVGKWGAQYFDSSKPESVNKLKKVHSYLFNCTKIGSRLTRADMGDIFSNNQIDGNAYDMGAASDKIKSVYDEMETELFLLEEKCESYKQHVLAIITRARRMAEILKVPTLIEMTHDFYQEGKSIVLFVNYTDTITSLVERLEKDFGVGSIGQIHGKQTFKERLSDIADFQSDSKRIMVANIQSGGQCINLHDLNGNFPRASLVNPSYSAIGVLQSVGRTDRAYSKTDTYTRFVFAARSIEESVARKFNDKKNYIDTLHDGDLIPNGIGFNLVAGMNV